MKKKMFFLPLFIFYSFIVFDQCQFGERYSDSYLNVKKLKKLNDTSYVYIYSNGSMSQYILKKINRKENYIYYEDVGYFSVLKIKFDSSDRVERYFYKYNSGYWGSKGKGTAFFKYNNNGNIRISGWFEKHYGALIEYDILQYPECDLAKYKKKAIYDCVKFLNKWYVILNVQKSNIDKYHFFGRWKLIRQQKEKTSLIKIDWNYGFLGIKNTNTP